MRPGDLVKSNRATLVPLYDLNSRQVGELQAGEVALLVSTGAIELVGQPPQLTSWSLLLTTKHLAWCSTTTALQHA